MELTRTITKSHGFNIMSDFHKYDFACTISEQVPANISLEEFQKRSGDLWNMVVAEVYRDVHERYENDPNFRVVWIRRGMGLEQLRAFLLSSGVTV